MSAKANEIHLVRLYDAPLEAVWQAWVDPAKAALWWGPRGFTLTNHSKDLRPGGTWRYTMHGPDGTDYPNIATYLEVEPLAKLVYDHGATETTPPLFRVTVLFKTVGQQTQMDMTMTLDTPEAAAQTRQFIKQAGGNATWDRLAEYLAEQQTQPLFVINRSFAAPIEQMYQLWTEPAHIANWLPPTGFSMEFIHADIREGGSSFYSMGNGVVTMYGRAAYLTLKPHELLQYTQQFCDADGNISRHPFAPVWPETMLTTVRLVAESPTQTRVTVTWQPHGTVTDAELAVFLQARGGMTQGWTGSFDKLDTLLGA